MEGREDEAGSVRGKGEGDGAAACTAPTFIRMAQMALKMPRAANRTGARAPVLVKTRFPISLEYICAKRFEEFLVGIGLSHP